jgi:hypothetical protein
MKQVKQKGGKKFIHLRKYLFFGEMESYYL